MTNQTKVDNAIQADQKQFGWQRFNWLLIPLVILIIFLSLGAVMFNPTPAEDVAKTHVIDDHLQLEQTIQVMAARYNAMAAYYDAQDRLLDNKAASTRYTGLAAYYNAAKSKNSAIEAASARYTGLAAYYTNQK